MLLKIIGQDRLIADIDLLLRSMLNGENFNILLSAGSGYGKTTLAWILMHHLGWENTGEYILAPNFIDINKRKRVHVIDEIHKLPNPEILYPYMDSEDYIFILCTNLGGFIPEPLKNRCISYTFDRYTHEDIIEIIKMYLRNSSKYSSVFIEEIANHSTDIPREIKNLCIKLSIYFEWNNIPTSLDEFKTILNKLGFKDNGLTYEDEIYLATIQQLKRASLKTLSALSHLDVNTITFDIEPRLLYLGKIRITPRGREYVI